MNKRCIVNVATGEFYCKMQDRLLRSFASCVDRATIYSKAMNPVYNIPIQLKYSNSKGIDLILWKDLLPTGSRSHSESPYGFKVHAIKAAYDSGYTSILWLDSQAYAVKDDVSPIFNKMETEGYYVMSHIAPLNQFVGSFALQHYQLSRRYLDGHNLPSGTCYGFDVTGRGFPLIMDMIAAERDGYFRSEVSGDIVHRHDEAILAITLIRHSAPVFTFDPLFQSDSPECVIRSGAEMKL